MSRPLMEKLSAYGRRFIPELTEQERVEMGAMPSEGAKLIPVRAQISADLKWFMDQIIQNQLSPIRSVSKYIAAALLDRIQADIYLIRSDTVKGDFRRSEMLRERFGRYMREGELVQDAIMVKDAVRLNLRRDRLETATYEAKEALRIMADTPENMKRQVSEVLFGAPMMGEKLDKDSLGPQEPQGDVGRFIWAVGETTDWEKEEDPTMEYLRAVLSPSKKESDDPSH